MAELADTLVVSDDDRLDQAEAAVRSYCGWHIAPSRTETVTVAGMRGRVIILPSLHVTEVVSVTADDTVLADDAYDCTEAGVLTLSNCDYFWGYSKVVVEFTHGYDIPPADVVSVVKAIALRGKANPAGLMTSQNAGPFSATFATSAPVEEKRALDRYKLPARP